MAMHVWFCPNEDCVNFYGAPQRDLPQMVATLESLGGSFTGSQCYCGEWLDAATCLQQVTDSWQRRAPVSAEAPE